MTIVLAAVWGRSWEVDSCCDCGVELIESGRRRETFIRARPHERLNKEN
jgi:hypothetical protein